MEPNTLSACIYCPGEKPRNKKLAKRLRDTRANRARELMLYRVLALALAREGRRAWLIP